MEYITKQIPSIAGAIPITLLLAVCTTGIGLITGIIGALMLIHKVPVMSRITKIYMAVVRGIPALILIYIAYYGLPKFILAFSEAYNLGWSVNGIPNIIFAIIALSIERSAYMIEMVRGAIFSVDAGQMEATKSVGMTTLQGYRRVIFPQAAVTALPNFGNLFIGAIKGSSLAYVVGVMEITATANVEACRSYRFIELYIVISLIYWIINAVFEQVFRASEKGLAKYKAHV